MIGRSIFAIPLSTLPVTLILATSNSNWVSKRHPSTALLVSPTGNLMPRTRSCAVKRPIELRALPGCAGSKILNRKEYWHDKRGVDRNGRHRQRGASRYALPRDAREWAHGDRLRGGQDEEAQDHDPRRGQGQPGADALRSHEGANQLPAQGRGPGGAAARAPAAVPAALALISGEFRMPKGEQRSNREHKKPKQPKKPVAPAARFIPAPARSFDPWPGKKT